MRMLSQDWQPRSKKIEHRVASFLVLYICIRYHQKLATRPKTAPCHVPTMNGNLVVIKERKKIT